MLTQARIKTVLVVANLRALQGVQLPNGQIGATLRSLCLALSLNLSGQRQRLRRQPLLAGALVTVMLKTGSGRQEVDVLLAWAIPVWLAGVQSTRLDDAKRANIQAIQTQAVQALYQAFWDVAVPAEEAVEGEVIAEESLDARLEARLAAIEAALLDKARLETRLAAIETRQDAIEETVRGVAGGLAALTGRVAADERLLAATIERLLGVQHSQRQRALQEGQKQPDRQRRGRRGRGRPRRGNSDKR